MTFGEFLQGKIDGLGKTQKECAKSIGASEASISEWLNDVKQPSRRYLTPIAKLISVDVKELLKRLT